MDPLGWGVSGIVCQIWQTRQPRRRGAGPAVACKCLLAKALAGRTRLAWILERSVLRTRPDPMSLRILYDEHSGALSYLLADEAAHEAALVDPRSGDRPVLMALLDEAGLRLRWVLRTHEHDGHDDQPPGEFGRLLHLGAPVVQGARREGVCSVADGERLPLGAGFVQVLHTPGHTAHCLSYLWQDRVFCGDLLTVDACPWQPGPAQPAALWDSVQQRIFTLPDETLLYAGHARRARVVSTVLEQRRWNPHFAGLTRDGFFARMGSMAVQR